jgi:GMP synthase-like glutamine amidotransferase
MRTLIIDNYLPNSPQLEHLYDIVKDITVHTVEVKEYSAISSGEDFKLFDAIVLSGSQHKLAESEIFEAYASEVEFLRRTKKPVLGICFGHQLISMAFGVSVMSTGMMLIGDNMIRNIVNLADSPNCAIETIKHQVLPIYGVQFHPERFDDKHPAGIVILENFFNIATLYMK